MDRAAPDDLETFEAWLQEERRFAAAAMAKSISATQRVRERPVFAQTIRPRPGSVVASPEFGDYNPEPDYFFHWLRDSALVMDALRELMEAGLAPIDGHGAFADFIGFSLSLGAIDATDAAPDPAHVDPRFRQYLRGAEEICALEGDRLLAEPRFNPDGSLDILKWARPQHDGPALRALTLMRYWPLCPPGATKNALQELIAQDLGFVQRHALEPSFDIWEEAPGQHYYTRIVHLGALRHGADWLRSTGRAGDAPACDAQAKALRTALDAHWDVDRNYYLARADRSGLHDDKEPDFAVILGVLHAALPDGAHSLFDPGVQATLTQLELLFSRSLDINRALPARCGPALGRYPSDRYFGGGAFYFTTLGAAEFYFCRAEALAAQDGEMAVALFAQGDGFLATVRIFTPPSGELSEQFDRATGRQTSARNLAWSYAAFITALKARARAGAALGAGRARCALARDRKNGGEGGI